MTINDVFFAWSSFVGNDFFNLVFTWIFLTFLFGAIYDYIV